MRTIRPVALMSLLALCALSRAAEPVPKPGSTIRQPAPPIPALSVEQLQKEVATLQAQVAELRSVLQVSQGDVRLQGNSVTIVSGTNLAVQAGSNLAASIGGNASVQVAKDLNVVADNVLFESRKASYIRTNTDLTLQVGRNLQGNVAANTQLRSGGQTTIEASATLALKGASITQN